jgi:hypothetical protein
MAVWLPALEAGRTIPPPSPPGKLLVLISVRDWIDPRAIVRLEGLSKLENLMASLGIEPATLRLVAQCLSQAGVCKVGKFVYIGLQDPVSSNWETVGIFLNRILIYAQKPTPLTNFHHEDGGRMYLRDGGNIADIHEV